MEVLAEPGLTDQPEHAGADLGGQVGHAVLAQPQPNSQSVLIRTGPRQLAARVEPGRTQVIGGHQEVLDHLGRWKHGDRRWRSATARSGWWTGNGWPG